MPMTLSDHLKVLPFFVISFKQTWHLLFDPRKTKSTWTIWKPYLSRSCISFFFFDCLPLFPLALIIFYIVVFWINRYSSHAVKTQLTCVYESSTIKPSHLWTCQIHNFYLFIPWIAKTVSLFLSRLSVRSSCLLVFTMSDLYLFAFQFT